MKIIYKGSCKTLFFSKLDHLHIKSPSPQSPPGWKGEKRLSGTDTEWRSQEGVPSGYRKVLQLLVKKINNLELTRPFWKAIRSNPINKSNIPVIIWMKLEIDNI
ncbi:MAG: hypothetical protein WCO98_16350 [bacterium]